LFLIGLQTYGTIKLKGNTMPFATTTPTTHTNRPFAPQNTMYLLLDALNRYLLTANQKLDEANHYGYRKHIRRIDELNHYKRLCFRSPRDILNSYKEFLNSYKLNYEIKVEKPHQSYRLNIMGEPSASDRTNIAAFIYNLRSSDYAY